MASRRQKGRDGLSPKNEVMPRSATPVRRTPMSLSRRFVQVCTSAAAEALADENLTPLTSGILAYLNRVSGEPNIDQNSLAERMGIDRSHASLLVDKLVNRGLVDRQTNPENRRAHLLRLTAAGEKVYTRTRPRFDAGQQKILSVPSIGRTKNCFLTCCFASSKEIAFSQSQAQAAEGARPESPSQSDTRLPFRTDGVSAHRPQSSAQPE